MEKFLNYLRPIIQRKPIMHVAVSAIYLLCAAFLKWTIHPALDTLFFLIGGILGMYLMDGAEVLFKINSPSPFRSVLFAALLSVSMFFVVTSSGSALASGLVLMTFVTLLLWFGQEFMPTGNPSLWFRQFADPVGDVMQKTSFGVFVATFVVVSVLFVR
jgi:hypothetical protein